jgi:hypothetical protein
MGVASAACWNPLPHPPCIEPLLGTARCSFFCLKCAAGGMLATHAVNLTAHTSHHSAPCCSWGDVADPRFGDNHVYDYASDAWDPATYPPAKFVSEFGFMSLPSFAGGS